MKLSEATGGGAPSGGMKLSDVTKPSESGTGDLQDPNVLVAMGASAPELGYAARGAIAGTVGGFGDVESLARKGLNLAGADVSEETFLPTTEDVSQVLPGEAPSTPDEKNWQAAGTFLSPALLTGGGALGRALSAGGRAAKLGEAVKSGEMGNEILARPRGAAAARKEAADKAYLQADEAMAAKHAEIPWQEHPSGRAFLDDLDQQISTVDATKETAATRGDLQRIKDDLQGAEKPGGGTAYSEPKVIREVLRRLRDRASGAPETGFDAIEQQRAGNLADRLATSVEQWEPSLRAADDQYRAMSAKLYPEGVRPGKFAREAERAESAINLLETQMKNGAVPKKEIVAAIRQTLNNKSVTRLIDPEKARELNSRLDSIDRAAARGKNYRRAAGIGTAAALGTSLGSHLFGGH